jgi:hypothetical protein
MKGGVRVLTFFAHPLQHPHSSDSVTTYRFVK